MNSRKLLNLGLLVLVVGLGVIVMSDFTDKTSIAEPKKLSDLDPADINQISISLESDKPIELKRVNDNWRMIKPIEIAANEVQVFSLLSLLNTISYGKYKVAEADLAKYGLKPPTLTIEFNQNRFAIGDENPVNHRRYVLFNDNIHLIQDHYSNIAKSAPSGLINLTLIPKNSKITSLQLVDFKLVLLDGRWSMIPEPADPVSQDSLREFIDNWQFTQALEASMTGSVATPKINYQEVRIEFNTDTPAMDLLTFATKNETLIVNPKLGVQYHLTREVGRRLFQLGEPKPTP